MIVAQDRELVAARRRFYIPQVSLQAGVGNNLNRGGAGSNLSGLGIDDESWNIGLVATLPLYNGGALRATNARARRALRQLELERLNLREQIEAGMRIALHQTGGSYPAVELSADAARAANENLVLITDAYSKGAVSVTDLIDAQNAHLCHRHCKNDPLTAT